MSLRTAQANFKKAFIDEEKTLTEKFLKEIRNYLAKKSEPRHKELLESMDGGEPLASFFCRNDICDELVIELLKREIPFLLVSNRKGEYGFIIRSSDRALTNEAIKTVLKKLGAYCEIVTGAELVTIVQKIRNNDKGLLAINGLTFKEMKMLEKLCRKGGFLEHIAEDKMSDGTYRFMVYGRQAAADQNFAAIIFELAMMLDGPNNKIFKHRMDNELKVESLRADNFGRKNGITSPIYIVGSGNQYMKIEQDSFEFGYAVRHKGQIELEQQFACNKDSPGFNEYEISYLNRIPDPASTTDEKLMMEHFESRYKRDALDFGMTMEEKRSYFGEKILIASIMEVVFRNALHDDIMNVSDRWMEKTAHITFEAGKVLNGLIHDDVPTGYDAADMEELRPVIAEYGIQIGHYVGVAEIMQGISITNERGSLEISGDLHERLEDLHENFVTDDRETSSRTEEMEVSNSEYEYSRSTY